MMRAAGPRRSARTLRQSSVVVVLATVTAQPCFPAGARRPLAPSTVHQWYRSSNWLGGPTLSLIRLAIYQEQSHSTTPRVMLRRGGGIVQSLTLLVRSTADCFAVLRPPPWSVPVASSARSSPQRSPRMPAVRQCWCRRLRRHALDGRLGGRAVAASTCRPIRSRSWGCARRRSSIPQRGRFRRK
jgi:hypothetical protein